MPKRGRVLIWPSVFDKEPNKKDGRTSHQALPVEEGVKYGKPGTSKLTNNSTPVAIAS